MSISHTEEIFFSSQEGTINEALVLVSIATRYLRRWYLRACSFATLSEDALLSLGLVDVPPILTGFVVISIE